MAVGGTAATAARARQHDPSRPAVSRSSGSSSSAAALSTYTVAYNPESHWSVLTQLWGSTWPKVLPFCILNILLMVLVTVIDDKYHNNPKSFIRLQVSNRGHTFLTFVVSFLLVSRVNTAVSRYNAARDALEVMYRESRELVQYACLFSMHVSTQSAQQWRKQVAYRTLLLLRTAMAVVDYPSTHVPAWDLPELTGVERDTVQQCRFMSNPALRHYAHTEHTEWEETMRVPIRLAHLLRKTIVQQSKALTAEASTTTPAAAMTAVQEGRLQTGVDAFLNGYYGIRTFLTTPVPFPLVQMARTFAFLYAFTIPFVMLTDDSGLPAHCVTVFLVTYGFLGLEVVAMELDNPFGNDANDFNKLAMAHTTFEDIYLILYDVDGREHADQLRFLMQGDDSTETPSPTDHAWLLDQTWNRQDASATAEQQ